MDGGKFALPKAKLAAGTAKVAQGRLGRTINNAKEKFAVQGIRTKLRQALKMIYDRYKISELVVIC